MLTLYHHWDSVCSFKVRMCLIEKKLDYQEQVVDLIQFQNLDPAYIALNPNGVVPTLKDDDEIIIESSIINEYLEHKYDSPCQGKNARTGEITGRRALPRTAPRSLPAHGKAHADEFKQGRNR